jgi:hypothetical protein
MLAISGWTWVFGAALAVVVLAILAKTTFDLWRRLKQLNRTLQSASGKLNEVLDEMRADLDQASEGLAGLRQQREELQG